MPNPYELRKAVTLPPTNWTGAAQPLIRGLGQVVLPTSGWPVSNPPPVSLLDRYQGAGLSADLHAVASGEAPTPLDGVGEMIRSLGGAARSLWDQVPTVPGPRELLNRITPPSIPSPLGVAQGASQAITSAIPAPSPDFSQAGNALLGLGHYAAEGGPIPGIVEAIKPSIQSAVDFIATPEKDLKKQEDIAISAAKKEKIDPTAAFGAKSDLGQQTLLSFPVADIPKPPLETAFQQGMPKEEFPLPDRPMVAEPDYTDVDAWLEKAMPKKSDRDWVKLQRQAAAAGLARGAADWDSRRGWGSLFAGAFAGAGEQGLKAKAAGLEEEDQFAKEMRNYSMTRAENALGRSKLGAEIAQTNAQNQYADELDAVNQANKRQETIYDIQQRNLANMHQASINNTRTMYADEVRRIQEGQPAIVSATKDGVLVKTQKDGKMELTHQPWKSKSMDAPEMKALIQQHGKDSAVVRQHVFADLGHQQNWPAYKYELAKDALKTAPEIFGENYEIIKKEVETRLVGKYGGPGSQKYAEEWEDAMAQMLSQYVDITNKDTMSLLAGKGSQGALYLLAGAHAGE